MLVNRRRMKQARAAGDAHTSAYYLGVVLGLSLAEGRKIEAMPVPAALRSRMARSLRLLHIADTTLNTALERAVACDAAGFQAAAATLDKLGPGLNASLDAGGERYSSIAPPLRRRCRRKVYDGSRSRSARYSAKLV